MSAELSGAWNFTKYPIFPFDVELHHFEGTPLYKRVRSDLVDSPYDLQVLNQTTVSFLVRGGTGTCRFKTSEDLIAPFIKMRVMEQAAVKLADVRKLQEAKILNSIANDCYAALRRIAAIEVKSEPNLANLSNDDKRYLDLIITSPQVLGGTGIPLPVFHRLMAAKKVRINKDGLVESF